MQKIFCSFLLINLFFINSYNLAKSMPLINDRDYICSWAVGTNLSTGKKFWDWEFENGKFANYAIQNGWSCGVTSIPKTDSPLAKSFKKKNIFSRRQIQSQLKFYHQGLGFDRQLFFQKIH